MNKTNSCNNCGKQGHSFHQCKLPITSYGIILFRSTPKGLQFLMIRRKDSFGYIDFIRGKYLSHNIEHIQNIVNEMSSQEKCRLKNESFENLWNLMWGETTNIQYKSEEFASCKKMDSLKNGIFIDGEKITLNDIIENSNTKWEETEWEFPKGRRNYQEKDIECALREFEEETGIPQQNICIIENVLPFEEIFIGTNYKSYKHKYFLAYVNNDNNNNNNNNCLSDNNEILNNFQKTEVSKIEWKSIDECLQSIRPYSLEKKKLITNIYKVLEEYRLYS